MSQFEHSVFFLVTFRRSALGRSFMGRPSSKYPVRSALLDLQIINLGSCARILV